MTARVVAWRRDKHVVAVRGDADAVFDAMKAANALCVYRWSRPQQAYMIATSRAGAVLDALRRHGHQVVWHGRSAVPPPPDVAGAGPIQQTLDLGGEPWHG